jgi:phosphonate transport system permease protein
VTTTPDTARDRHQPARLAVPPRRRRGTALAATLVILAAVVALHVLAWDKAQVSVSEFISGWHGMWAFLFGDSRNHGAFPPKWDWANVVSPGISECLVTLSMGLIGTTFSIPLALILALLGSRTTMRNPVIYWITRAIMSVLRAVPIFVWGLIFVTAVGLGPFPGALALLVHNTGVMGKLWSEAMEEVDQGPVEALRSAGANNVQTAMHVVLPSVVPQFSSLFLYRLDVNIRDAALLGIVGAGGIGFYITQAVQLFRFNEMMTYIILVLILIFAVDIISALIRRRLARS